MPLTNKPSILFVCRANMIRSPMAEAIFRSKLVNTTSDWKDYLVGSAGTWTREGKPAIKEAVLVMQKRGIDISKHRSRMVSNELLKKFSLILTMEPGQKEALRVEFPEIAKKVFTLTEVCENTNIETIIEDPVGGTLADFEQTANEIEYWISNGISKICDLAKQI